MVVLEVVVVDAQIKMAADRRRDLALVADRKRRIRADLADQRAGEDAANRRIRGHAAAVRAGRTRQVAGVVAHLDLAGRLEVDDVALSHFVARVGPALLRVHGDRLLILTATESADHARRAAGVFKLTTRDDAVAIGISVVEALVR